MVLELLPQEFTKAIEEENLLDLERELELIPSPEARKDIINLAFRFAAADRHLVVVKKLLEITPDPKKRLDMIKSNNYQEFIGAVCKSNFAVAETIFMAVDPKERERMTDVADSNLKLKLPTANIGLLSFEYLYSALSQNQQNVMNNSRKSKSYITSKDFTNLYSNNDNDFAHKTNKKLDSGLSRQAINGFNKDFINRVINKLDQSFIQSICVLRDSKLEINISKIFDSIKFIPNILGLAQIGVNKLQESFFNHFKLPQFAVQKILSYCYGEKSTLNGADIEKLHSIIGDINKQVIDTSAVKYLNKSPKVNFVEKYLEQTKKAENLSTGRYG